MLDPTSEMQEDNLSEDPGSTMTEDDEAEQEKNGADKDVEKDNSRRHPSESGLRRLGGYVDVHFRDSYESENIFFLAVLLVEKESENAFGIMGIAGEIS